MLQSFYGTSPAERGGRCRQATPWLHGNANTGCGTGHYLLLGQIVHTQMLPMAG